MDQLGARSFRLDIDTGMGYLLPPLDKPISGDGLFEAVESAGFVLLGLELEVLGSLLAATEEGTVHIEPEGGGQQSFALVQGQAESDRGVWNRMAPDLGRVGARLWLKGRVDLDRAGAPVLQVTDFRWIED